MTNFEAMYHILFNAMTDALRQMEQGNLKKAEEILMTAQQTTEEIYIDNSGI